MDMIGASAYTWEIQHMLGHHPYTNLLDVVEEERKGRNVDCKIEEKDQARRSVLQPLVSLCACYSGVTSIDLMSSFYL